MKKIFSLLLFLILLSPYRTSAQLVSKQGIPIVNGTGTNTTLITPNIGDATANTINSNTFTPGTGTLTLNGFTLNLTGTLGTNAFNSTAFITSSGTATVSNSVKSPLRTIICGIGDSIMAGTTPPNASDGSQAYTAYLGNQPYFTGISTVYNFGVGSTFSTDGTSSYMQSNGPHSIFTSSSNSSSYKILLVHYGSNDASSGRSLTGIFKPAMDAILALAESDSINAIVFLTVMNRGDITGSVPGDAPVNTLLLRSYNQYIRSLPITHPSLLVYDAASRFPDPSDVTWFGPETSYHYTHPNFTANLLIAQDLNNLFIGKGASNPFGVPATQDGINQFTNLQYFSGAATFSAPASFPGTISGKLTVTGTNEVLGGSLRVSSSNTSLPVTISLEENNLTPVWTLKADAFSSGSGAGLEIIDSLVGGGGFTTARCTAGSISDAWTFFTPVTVNGNITQIGNITSSGTATFNGANLALSSSNTSLPVSLMFQENNGTTVWKQVVNAFNIGGAFTIVDALASGGAFTVASCSEGSSSDVWSFFVPISSNKNITTTGTFSGNGSGITNLNASSIGSGVVPAANGGAGTINGLLKANGSGVVSQAVAGTDYSTATQINLTGTGATPTIVAGAGDGTGGTASIVGTNSEGEITLVAGTLPSVSAVIGTVTFANSFAFATGSRVIVWPSNTSASTLGFLPYIGSATTGFTINAGTIGLGAATTYKYNYQVMGD